MGNKHCDGRFCFLVKLDNCSVDSKIIKKEADTFVSASFVSINAWLQILRMQLGESPQLHQSQPWLLPF